MTEDSMRAVGFLCPQCGQSVVVERTVFQMMAGDSAIPCPCGKSAVFIRPMGDRTSFTIPCTVCHRDHEVTCATNALLHQRAIAFTCGTSGLECCFVGEVAPVFQALERLESAAAKLEEGAGEGTFLDPVMMEEVLAELRDIAERDGISCQCGGKTWSLRVHFSAVDLTCSQCGGVLRLPAATADDLDALCCQSKLVIKGRGH